MCLLECLNKGATDYYLSKLYGVSCCENDYELISLLVWAYEKSCCSGNKEEILLKLKKLTGQCISCKKCISTLEIYSNDEWYNTQGYIDCLNYEFEQNGFIEEIVNIERFCNNLNIKINYKSLCNKLVVKVKSSRIKCDLVSKIDSNKVCKIVGDINQSNTKEQNTYINMEEKLCDIILETIQNNK